MRRMGRSFLRKAVVNENFRFGRHLKSKSALFCLVYLVQIWARRRGRSAQFDREDEDAPILYPRTSNADQGAQNSAEEEHQKAPYAPPSRRGGEHNRRGARPQALYKVGDNLLQRILNCVEQTSSSNELKQIKGNHDTQVNSSSPLLLPGAL
jgi:hypothetical protein